MYYTSPNHQGYNASYIMDTEVIWNISNLDNNNNNKGLNIGIHIKNCSGINVGGCKIHNIDPALIKYDDRGVGILSENSDINISSGGDQFCIDAVNCLDNCVGTNSGAGNNFENLSFGITGTGNHISIRNSEFLHCMYSIKLNNFISTTIANCTFLKNINLTNIQRDLSNYFILNSNINYPNPKPFEIETSNSSFNTIFKNEFTLNNDYYPSVSINVKNCGNKLSEVKNNKFNLNYMEGVSTSNVNAIEVEENCLGLNIICNEFNRYGCDIRLLSNSIIGNFGTSANAPGMNKFSPPYSISPSSTRINIFEEPNVSSGTYIHNNASNETPSINSTTINSTSFYTQNPNCDISCEELMSVGFEFTQDKPNNITLTPNPTTNSIKVINNTLHTITSVIIYNSIGQIIYSNSFIENEIELHKLTESKGIYNILLRYSDNSFSSHKIVLE